MASWPAKDPDDVLDYPLTWAKQMAKDQDTIAAYEPFIAAGSDGALEVMTGPNTDALGDAPSFTDTATLLWLSGGTTGQSYLIVNRIRTAGGRQYDHTRTITIKER